MGLRYVQYDQRVAVTIYTQAVDPQKIGGVQVSRGRVVMLVRSLPMLWREEV